MDKLTSTYYLYILIFTIHLCSSKLDIHSRIKIKISLQCTNGTSLLSDESQSAEPHNLYTKIYQVVLDLLSKTDDDSGEKRRRRKRRSSKRYKRSIKLVFPGTKWCGLGDVAHNYSDIGINVHTDKCCRSHDNCPHNIESFQTKYGMHNPEMYTRSDCDCEEIFWQCLHLAKCESPTLKDRFAAGMIGELYFTELKTYCIKFPPKSCTGSLLCLNNEPRFEMNKQF